MGAKRKQTYWISAATLALIFGAFILVFRDALPEIAEHLRAVPLRGVLALLAMGFVYETMEAAVGLVLLAGAMIITVAQLYLTGTIGHRKEA